MKLLLALVPSILYLTVSVGGQSQDCFSGMQQCMMTYVTNVGKNIQNSNKQAVCRDLNVYTKCLNDLNCDSSDSHKVQKDKQKELSDKGFNCDEGSGATTTRIGSIFFATMTTVLFVYFLEIF